MKPEPAVRPADIWLASDGSGRLVLVLDLPRHVIKLFVDGLPSVVAKCSVYRLPVGLLVGFVVLQIRVHQVRVLVPLHDEKSFSWLEQCLSEGSVSCTFTDVDACDGRQFNCLVDLPALGPDVLQGMRQAPGVSAGDVLLVIASSVPSMLQPSAVTSLSGAEVEAVSVCFVRDFFNTEACLSVARELIRRSGAETRSTHVIGSSPS